MTFGDTVQFTLFTNDPALAARADRAGVDRIGLDLERIGKAQRQPGRKSWVSDHRLEQLHSVGEAVKHGRLFVRTNPMHEGLPEEVSRCLTMGARVLMLPMFTTVAEAARFVELVDGRAEVSLLVETPAAGIRIRELVKLEGVSEIHVGLNDMSLGLGLASHFEVLVSDFLTNIARVVVDAGLPFGFGGVGRLGDSSLPIPPDLVYAQYPRLRATRALISRVFVTPDQARLDLQDEVRITRQRLTFWARQPEDELQRATVALMTAVSSLIVAQEKAGGQRSRA
ncbi:MAG: aldolase/citrate lyase family protein [Acidobacteriota bacterium]